MTARRLMLLAGLALFVGTGLYSLLLPWLQDRRLPTRADVEACGALLARDWGERDLVRIEPYWYRENSDVLLGAIEARTHAPFAWYDERPQLDLEHAWRFDGVWIVHLPRVTGLDAARLVPPEARVVDVRRCGDRLELVRVETPRATVRFDLLAEVSRATVRRVTRDGATPCPWDGRRFRCEGPPWKNVGLRWKDLGGARRTCLYLEPVPDGGRVEVVFSDVVLGARTLVWGGLSQQAARKPHGGDVTLQVLIGGTSRVQHSEPHREYRWNRFELDTREVAGRPTELAFVVGAMKAGWRQFCIDALSVDPPGAEGAP